MFLGIRGIYREHLVTQWLASAKLVSEDSQCHDILVLLGGDHRISEMPVGSGPQWVIYS
jgi:hypothetical protein